MKYYGLIRVRTEPARLKQAEKIVCDNERHALFVSHFRIMQDTEKICELSCRYLSRVLANALFLFMRIDLSP